MTAHSLVPFMLARCCNRLLSAVLPLLRRADFHHSQPQSCSHCSGMQVHVLPALSDNYMYLVVDEVTGEAAIVDPVEPEKVLSAVQQHGARLSTILTTHHHWDHAGGNEKMVAAAGGELRVVGGDERIPALNHMVRDGDCIKVGSLLVQCLSTPCHTSGHICYYIRDAASAADAAVFTGDTLFIAGCGKFFEGTAAQMHAALISKLSALPDDTRVYCGHEYTVNNLKFAKTVEPENGDLLAKMEWAIAQRARNHPTVPSSVGQEKSFNPFMRVSQSSVQAHTGTSGDPVATMGALRRDKDNFRP